MPMKITRLLTHWDADEAHTIIEFLDRLRDELWETYGDDVIDLLRTASISHTTDNQQTQLPFDDDVEF